MADTPRPLRIRERKFVEAYLGPAEFDSTAAARIAGYAGEGHNLQTTGSRTLHREPVQAAIETRVRELMNADEFLGILAEVARRDDREFIQIRTDARGAVVEAKMVLADKIRANELILKALGAFTEKVEHTVVPKRIVGVDLDKI